MCYCCNCTDPENEVITVFLLYGEQRKFKMQKKTMAELQVFFTFLPERVNKRLINNQ